MRVLKQTFNLLRILFIQTFFKCKDCGCVIGRDTGPPDGWTLGDGRRVCDACCIKDTQLRIHRVFEQCALAKTKTKTIT